MAEAVAQHELFTPTGFVPGVEVDEAAARRQLREQVAHLEAELAGLFCSTYPRTGFEWNVRSRGGPRLLSIAELEELRDDLATRLQENRRMLGDRTYVEELHRRRIEEMLLAPEEHKWVRVQNSDIGEKGCKSWHVVPRLGLVGMMMGWWRVKISSGCPLARGRWCPLLRYQIDETSLGIPRLRAEAAPDEVEATWSVLR